MRKMIEPEQVELSDAAIIEPYSTRSLEDGMSLTESFAPRTIQSVKMFVKRFRPLMIARLNNTYPSRSSENLFRPVEYYKTINGDGLISVCIKFSSGRRNEIAVYDHVTEELKQVGSIPRHHFKQSVNASVFCMCDPKFVEGVIGSMTQDAQYFAVFAHSKNLRVVNVFDICNAVCLYEKDLSRSEYFQDCQPTGVALVPTGVSKSHFDIAVLSYNMEVRVWNTGDCMGRVVKLVDARPSFGLGFVVINPRQSFLRFSPDGRYLCVLAYLDEMYICILMDAISLQPLFRMPYDFTYGQFCCIFPCFTVCGSRFVMFTPSDHYYDIDKYQLQFYEIPRVLQSLKDLCRLSILSVLNRSNLNKLPLPNDLASFLSGGRNVSVNSQKHKNCSVM